jgi:hypothetical protein
MACRELGDIWMSEFREVKLPAELCLAAERKFAAKFGCIEELLTFLLREVTEDAAVRLDEAEQRIIEERLKGLGYI